MSDAERFDLVVWLHAQFEAIAFGDCWPDGTRRSTGNAFDPACDFRAPPPPPAPVDYSGVSETKAARHKRVRREAKRKLARAEA